MTAALVGGVNWHAVRIDDEAMEAFCTAAASRKAADARSVLDRARNPQPPRAALMATPHVAVDLDTETVRTIDGDVIRMRSFTPPEPHPGLEIVYIHGGGWVSGDTDALAPFVTELAARSGAKAWSIDYRLAPEHPFPLPLRDVLSALTVLASTTATRLVIVGDSAGGNLAIHALKLMTSAMRSRIAGLAVAYPALDPGMSSASAVDHAAAPTLDTATMREFWRDYLGEDVVEDYDPIPTDAIDQGEHPPTFVIVTGRDPLADDGRAYADRLARAGVAVQAIEYPAAPHGILWMSGALDEGADAVERVAAFARSHARLPEKERADD
jgi:acetyl esterase